MKKKGSVSIQFNWIFVLVAGALILAGTVTFITMQGNLSEKQNSAKTFEVIKTFITGAYVSKGKSIELPIDGIEMNYDENQLSINGVSQTEYLLFAPHKIKGYHLLIWSKSLEMPFLVSNIAFMTSPEVRYIAVYDNSNPSSVRLKDEINDSFDNRTSLSFVLKNDLNSVQDENNYLVVIAFLDVPLNPNLPYIKGDKIGVEVQPDNDNFTGTLNFYSYKKMRPTGNSVFLGSGMLTGAFISGDFSIYTSNVKQIFLRIKAMSDILAQKSSALKSLNTNPDLDVRYETASQKLFDLENLANILSQNPNQLVTKKSELIQTIETLNIQNKKLFMKSSPTIY